MQKRLLWKIDESFQVTTIRQLAGQPETTSTVKVVWNEDEIRMTAAEFQHIVSGIPQQPGIYKYYDAGNELIYVGKAKNIRKRVSSYFNKTSNQLQDP